MEDPIVSDTDRHLAEQEAQERADEAHEAAKAAYIEALRQDAERLYDVTLQWIGDDQVSGIDVTLALVISGLATDEDRANLIDTICKWASDYASDAPEYRTLEQIRQDAKDERAERENDA